MVKSLAKNLHNPLNIIQKSSLKKTDERQRITVCLKSVTIYFANLDNGVDRLNNFEQGEIKRLYINNNKKAV